MTRPTPARQAAERRGRRAEAVAALWLALKGYRILARRARTPYGEVDLVAWRGGALVIVEVKARAASRAGLEAVSLRQRDRLRRAGLDLARRFRLGDAPIRLDLVVLAPGRWPLHVRGAWDEAG